MCSVIACVTACVIAYTSHMYNESNIHGCPWNARLPNPCLLVSAAVYLGAGFPGALLQHSGSLDIV